MWRHVKHGRNNGENQGMLTAKTYTYLEKYFLGILKKSVHSFGLKIILEENESVLFFFDFFC